MCVLISCEVAGDQVPPWFAETKSLQVKRRKKSPEPSIDHDALYLARRMAARLNCPLVSYPWDYRLIRVDKSRGNQRLFGATAKKWSAEVRQRLINEIYLPYHEQLQQSLQGVVTRESFVIHLSIQTFPLKSPKGTIRRGDVGLVYDPSNSDQVDLTLDWIDEMWDAAEMLKVRRNSPRSGKVDSIVRAMSEKFTQDEYVGLEVLVNRSWAGRHVSLRDEAIDAMVDSLKSTLQWPAREAA